MAFLCRVSISPDSCCRQTEFRFERWGRLALVLSKFIPGLSTIAPPLAGAHAPWLAVLFAAEQPGRGDLGGRRDRRGMAFHAQIKRIHRSPEGLGTLAARRSAFCSADTSHSSGGSGGASTGRCASRASA